MTETQAYDKARRIAKSQNTIAIVVLVDTGYDDKTWDAVSLATYERDYDCGQFLTGVDEVEPE